MMRVYRITTTARNPKNGRNNFLNFECASPSIEALTDALNAGQIIHGDMLRTRCARHGVWEITERERMALTAAMVVRIEVPQWKFVEARESRAA